MLFLWLIVWLIAGTPAVVAWNAWLIALIVCAVLDFSGTRTIIR